MTTINLGWSVMDRVCVYAYMEIASPIIFRLESPTYNPTEQAINRQIAWPIYHPTRDALRATHEATIKTNQ